MKKTKAEKGITLIALIITIIVLLILAVVTIQAVQEHGIIGYAKKAQEEHKKAAEDENAALQQYADYIDQHTGGSSTGGSGEGNTGESETPPPKTTSTVKLYSADIHSIYAIITFEDGMTWHEWINSEYNSNIIEESQKSPVTITEEEDGTIKCEGLAGGPSMGTLVQKDDVIQSSDNYYYTNENDKLTCRLN